MTYTISLLIRHNYLNDLPSLDPELYRHLIFLKVMFLILPSISLSILAYIKFGSHDNQREENNASYITIDFMDNMCFFSLWSASRL